MTNDVLVGNKTASMVSLNTVKDSICVEPLPLSFRYFQEVFAECKVVKVWL